MKKVHFYVCLFSFLSCFAACRKTYGKKEFKNFPSGKYTGVFLFDSMPQLNCTREFVATKTTQTYINRKWNYVEFELLDFYKMEANPIELKIAITASEGNKTYYFNDGLKIEYFCIISENSLTFKRNYAKVPYPFPLNSPTSFTLTYTP